MWRLGEVFWCSLEQLLCCRRSSLVVVGALAVCLAGCGTPTPPTEASQSYNRLVRLAAAEARARSDSTFLWLRNNGTPEARRLA